MSCLDLGLRRPLPLAADPSLAPTFGTLAIGTALCLEPIPAS